MRTSLLCALLLVGCSAAPPVVDAGPGGDGGTDEVLFKVSGVAKVYPPAADFLADAGLDGGLIGLTVRVEEPLKVALDQPDGVFSTQTLDATGTFEKSGILASEINLGVAVGIRDPNDAGTRVVASATIVYDVALQESKPTKDVTGVAYAVPTAFHDKLTAAVTAAKIQSLASNKSTLFAAGFILGRVVDSAGKPVAGAQISPTPASQSARFFYPTADLSTVGTSTSSNGLFIFVHNGEMVNTFSFVVDQKPEYKKRNAGARKEAAVIIDVYPGLVAP